VSEHKLRAIGDILLSLLVVCGAAVLFVGAAELPPPRFEPLGSAAMPRILGVILCFLAAVVTGQAVLRLMREAPPPVSSVDAGNASEAGSPMRGAAVLVALVAYVAALDLLQADFVLATTCFVTVAGMAMTRIGWRQALVHGALGLILALLVSSVFTKFLYIDLG
jgi:putative tricarboxylic transport membrane protein